MAFGENQTVSPRNIIDNEYIMILYIFEIYLIFEIWSVDRQNPQENIKHMLSEKASLWGSWTRGKSREICKKWEMNLMNSSWSWNVGPSCGTYQYHKVSSIGIYRNSTVKYWLLLSLLKFWLYPLVNEHSYGKIHPFLMGKLTINGHFQWKITIFNG